MALIDKFSYAAEKIANALGHPIAFISAAFLIVSWAVVGDYFSWSERHSLFINTVTTIITFLLGFLILNTANRQGKAEQLKLDELIRSINDANDKFIKLEEKTSEEVLERDSEIKLNTDMENK